MPTIVKRRLPSGEFRYDAVIRVKGHQQEKITQRTPAAAMAAGKKREAELILERHVEPDHSNKKTVGEVCDYIVNHEIPRRLQRYKHGEVRHVLSPGSAVGLRGRDGQQPYRGKLGSLRDTFGHMTLKGFAATGVKAVQNLTDDAGLKGSTRNHYLSAASMIFRIAIAEGWWPKSRPNPFVGIELARNDAKTPRFLNPDEGEYERLVGACFATIKDYPDEPKAKLLPWAVILAVETGMRQMEEFGLPLGNLRLKIAIPEVIILHDPSTDGGPVTKGKKTRVVPLSPLALRAIEELRKLTGKGAVRLFEIDGQPLCTNALRYYFEHAVELAKIEGFTWHHLRHTFGSRLAMAGRSIVEIKELMGHSNIQTTMIYMHLAPSKKPEAIQAAYTQYSLGVVDSLGPAHNTSSGQTQGTSRLGASHPSQHTNEHSAPLELAPTT